MGNNMSQEFFQKAVSVFEKRNSTFHLGKEISGVSFTHNEPRAIPAGSYSIVEPDSRDDSRVIIVNIKTYNMYSISRKLIPKTKE